MDFYSRAFNGKFVALEKYFSTLYHFIESEVI
jgi:hypothetical protein